MTFTIRLIFLMAFLFPGAIHLRGQEVIVPLSHNPVIKETLQKNPGMISSRKTTASDTLKLPFIDDFSSQGIYPDTALWTDNFTFINSDYPINPPSVGVATFDAINALGDPYSNTVNAYGVADYLSSKPIDLSGLQSSDSVYLSFFYQPQGRGNAPEADDSLVLEFQNPSFSGSWQHIWSVNGSGSAPFRQVFIPIKDSGYLQNGFRFRFKNYATLSGNMDHWHIDYVQLDTNRTVLDTTISDVALIHRAPSLLKNFYEMPWDQFMVNPAGQMKDSIFMEVRNNSSVLHQVDYKYQIRSYDGTLLYNYPSTGSAVENVNAGAIYTLRLPVASQFTFPVASDTIFMFDAIIKGGTDNNRRNDTVRHYQRFHNYFAYDDGTAENAYGVQGIGGKLAYKFTLLKPDTLRGVKMFFNYIMNDASTKLFKLVVWSSLSPEKIIYQKVDQKPKYTDSINGFHTYWFDTALYVSGTFYVGWIQAAAETLNVGLDRNFSSNDKMYYNTTGTWQQSIIPGSWMIRPVVGDTSSVVGIPGSPQARLPEFSLFPNPADARLFIRSGPSIGNPFRYDIFNLLGETIITGEFRGNTTIDINSLPPGMYIITLRDEWNGLRKSLRFVVSR